MKDPNIGEFERMVRETQAKVEEEKRRFAADLPYAYEQAKQAEARTVRPTTTVGLILVEDDGSMHTFQASSNPVVRAVLDILAEYHRATSQHARFNSAHEGFAVIDEERDELWDEVKTNPKKNALRGLRMREEAIQLAAMALRFITEVVS